VLVVPRRHVADVMSAGVDDWLAVATTAGRMARWVVAAFDDQLGSWWSPQTADPAEITQAARRLVDRGRHDPETTFGLASTTS
jgi:hypothetical protein